METKQLSKGQVGWGIVKTFLGLGGMLVLWFLIFFVSNDILKLTLFGPCGPTSDFAAYLMFWPLYAGFIQLVYVVPFALMSWRKGKRGEVLGIGIGALVVLAINLIVIFRIRA